MKHYSSQRQKRKVQPDKIDVQIRKLKQMGSEHKNTML